LVLNSVKIFITVMNYKNEKQNLHEILVGVNQLISDTLTHRGEIKQLELEMAELFKEGKLSELRYHLESQTAKRACKDVNYCLKSLEWQKKQAIWKLRELG